MKSTLAMLLVLFLVLTAMPASAQLYIRNPPIPHIYRTYYFPCFYDWYASSSPPIGCMSSATCTVGIAPVGTPAQQIAVSWYEWWTCNNGVVHATGDTGMVDGVYIADEFNTYLYDLGLDVSGFSQVVTFETPPFQMVRTFQGFEYQDCNGIYQYSGGYNYDC